MVTVPKRDFEFPNNSMGSLFGPTAGVQRPYRPQNFRHGVPFSNGSHYSNPDVDHLPEAAADESDAAESLELFACFQHLVENELPDINLVSLKQVSIASSRGQDHTTTVSDLNGTLADVWLRAYGDRARRLCVNHCAVSLGHRFAQIARHRLP